MRRFNILRFCAYLFGVVILLIMLETLIAVTACCWMVTMQGRQVGTCGDLGNTVREIFTELLAGILALLAASRPHKSGDE